jgi:hypothetical protein
VSVDSRLEALEARVARLEAGGGGASAESGDGLDFSPLKDEHLDKPWANKAVGKDPPKWSGVSQIGRTFATAPAAWHESMAGFKRWKALKGKAENPVRMNEKTQKPWYENDVFESRLHSAWSKRNVNVSAEGATVVEDAGTGDDSIPF